MKFMFRYMKKYQRQIAVSLIIKSVGTISEFWIPFVLEYMLDNVAPQKDMNKMLCCGVLMITIAILVRQLNIIANRRAVKTASLCIYDIRQDLFRKTIELSGNQVDKYGLPSLTSRMTSDSYNVQSFIRSIQTMGVRAFLLLMGGMAATLLMDRGLALILFLLVPLILCAVIIISRKGIPLYERVQQRMDVIVRIMREAITGIRVVKALSKEEHEKERYEKANGDMFESDITASVVMALPGPVVTLVMNLGLTIVVVIGAYRVNAGLTKPGVILAFLTYFHMIVNGVNGLNRIFIMTSKANSSAKRIAAVIDEGKDGLEAVWPNEEVLENSEKNGEIDTCDEKADYIVFDHVNFRYKKSADKRNTFKEKQFVENPVSCEASEYELKDVCFSIKKGSSLGIIGATGSGKTTIVNLLMRFYDAENGCVMVAGSDVRSYEPAVLRKMFGVVFQNDVIFADTLYENISFGRDVDKKEAMEAARAALAADFIEQNEEGLNYKASIHGANLSGGQKQRILIARALADKPEILILDDSSSALDYKTDALLRHMIKERMKDTTTIMIAQRISSVMTMDSIIVMDDGKIIGCGTHESLMKECTLYREIYEVQMS